MSETSNRILSLLAEKGLSYGTLSEITKIPKSALQRYATGETEKIPTDRLETIANALNTSMEYLLGKTENKYPLGTIGRLMGDSVNREFQSDKQQKIICLIDSQLYNDICTLAEADDRTFENEMEWLLYNVVQNEIDDRTESTFDTTSFSK